MSAESTKKAYARAGVDVDLGNAVKSRIHDRVKVTHGPEVLGKVGGFGEDAFGVLAGTCAWIGHAVTRAVAATPLQRRKRGCTEYAFLSRIAFIADASRASPRVLPFHIIKAGRVEGSLLIREARDGFNAAISV